MRLSLRTCICAMLLGGPLCAWGWLALKHSSITLADLALFGSCVGLPALAMVAFMALLISEARGQD